MLLRTYTPVAKSIARYTALGSPAEHCGICRFYAAPNICARVLGPVVPAGWCKFFSKEAVFRPLAPYASGIPPGVSLDLSFMTPGTLDPRIAFTRASTATYFNSAGTLQTAVSNVPRWDYDPVTHALKGLLIEEARTNVIEGSGDLSNATLWTSYQASVTGNAVTSPDGTQAGAQITSSGAPGGRYNSVSNAFTNTAGTPQTVSCFFKWISGPTTLMLAVAGQGSFGGTGGDRTVQFNGQTGAFVSASAEVSSYSIASVGNGWWRVAGTFTPTTTNTSAALAAYASAGGTTFAAWGIQSEIGAFATSYIPTTTAAVTRAQDAATMPVGAWYNPSIGSARTTFINVAQSSGGTLNALFEFDDGTVNNSIWSMAYAAPGAFTPVTQAAVAGAATGYANYGPQTSTPIIKQASAWSAGTSLQQTTNGGAVQSVALTTLPTVTRLVLGSGTPGGLAPLNGCLRQFSYWPRALSNTELQSVTT
jgi:hypothetical protein